jgi:hypothetical protein
MTEATKNPVVVAVEEKLKELGHPEGSETALKVMVITSTLLIQKSINGWSDSDFIEALLCVNAALKVQMKQAPAKPVVMSPGSDARN